MPGIFIGFDSSPTRFGGTNRVNRTVAEILRRRFPVADRLEQADLQVLSTSWEAPPSPPRLFVDHGSFADAGFWAFTAPRLRANDSIFVSSRVCLRIAERLWTEPRPNLCHVPYFADTSVFRPATDRAQVRESVRADWSLPSEGPILLAVSGFLPRKNLHLALRVQHALSRHYPQASLLISGRPSPRHSSREYASALERLAGELGTAGRVRFVGVLSHAELAKLMAAADLLIHLTTSRIENFGLVVAEALASGLPVFASDWGGLRDLVRPKETGILARTFLTRNGPRVDWRSPLDDVVELLGDEDSWPGMSARAAQAARERLSPAAFEERLCRAVQEILQRPAEKDRPARLTERGEDLMFATVQLHRADRSIRSTGEEYRHLLRQDGGELCRFLTGPAATEERAPTATMSSCLYPALEFTADGISIAVNDPAWPGDHMVTERQALLAKLCDGARTLPEVLQSLPASHRDRRGSLRDAQELIDLGLLCPMRRTRELTAG